MKISVVPISFNQAKFLRDHLDRANMKGINDIVMPKIWWDSNYRSVHSYEKNSFKYF